MLPFPPELAAKSVAPNEDRLPLRGDQYVPLGGDRYAPLPSIKNSAAADLELVCCQAVSRQEVAWIWPGRIPIGKVTLIAGDPGVGKSVIAMDIAARVSRGLPFPASANTLPTSTPQATASPAAASQTVGEQATGEQSAVEPSTAGQAASGSAAPVCGSVLVLSACDDAADTILPRLAAAGADPARVFLLASLADLCRDFAQLQAAVERLPDCRLIVIDPINAFLGPSESHFHTVMRRVLVPLTRLARARGIAVVAIAQLRKASGPAIRSAAGSIGLASAAQSLWTVCPDPHDIRRRLLMPLKHNLIREAAGLAFEVVESIAEQAPRIEWRPELVVPPPEVVFARPQPPRPPSPERAAAREWLVQRLSAGPVPARQVLFEGGERGFQTRTLRRAFHELGGSTAKRGLVNGWWWKLAEGAGGGDAASNAAAAPPAASSGFETVAENGTVPVGSGSSGKNGTVPDGRGAAVSSPSTAPPSTAAQSADEPRGADAVPLDPPRSPQKAAVRFEGVTFDDDLGPVDAIRARLGDAFLAGPPPTVRESLRYLRQRDARRDPFFASTAGEPPAAARGGERETPDDPASSADQAAARAAACGYLATRLRASFRRSSPHHEHEPREPIRAAESRPATCCPAGR